MQFCAVCFDVDGTLGDTFPVCIPLMAEIFSRFAGKQFHTEDITRFFGINESGIAQQLIGDNWQAAADAFYIAYEAELKAQQVEPFAGIEELICTLRNQGVLTLLVTGKAPQSCRVTLAHWGLDAAFAKILCGGPDKLNKAAQIGALLQEFHLRPNELCYVGDALTDVTACRENSVTCLSALWQPLDLDKTAVRQANPNYCFTSVAALSNFLLPKVKPYPSFRQ